MSEKNHVLLTTKGIGIALTVIAFLGVIGSQLMKVYRWEATADNMEKLEERVGKNEQGIANIGGQLTGISKQLEEVNWRLRRMGNGRDS